MHSNSLAPLALTPFTSSEIRPGGWLSKQLNIQAGSLSGNLDKFWPDIKESKWIGGKREGWERLPYWLFGFIPLAYLLENEDMINRASRYIDIIITNQDKDGWICPCTYEERPHYDLWAAFLIAKVLVIYYECSKDIRIEDTLYKLYRNIDLHIDKHSLFNWAAFRWYEALIGLFWLYERRSEKWLLDLACKLKSQGFDYAGFMKDWPYKEPTGKNKWSLMNHVVNYAMMLKAAPLYGRITGDTDGSNVAEYQLDMLNQYHGLVHGVFSGDECLSGRKPIQGTELCAVVELMYSIEQILAVKPSVQWADKLEYIAFNTLPATISPDMWTHQYDQQVNQISCSVFSEESNPFLTNGPMANIFGLEPNYGCCTANFSQGWPHLALSTFYKHNKGIACPVLLPSSLNTELNHSKVRIQMDTEYPFNNILELTVHSSKETEFTLSLRIPEFVRQARLEGKEIESGQFLNIEKVWNGSQKIRIELVFDTVIEKGFMDLASIRRGPLLYSVGIEEEWRRIDYGSDEKLRVFPHCDYEVLPKSSFNYGLLDEHIEFSYKGIGDVPFNPTTAPIEGFANMAEIEWPQNNGVLMEYPDSLKAISPPRKMRIIPYGCTNLRLTQFPLLGAHEQQD